MGSGQSAVDAVTEERKRLRLLGERHPFSDDELRTLLRCFIYVSQKKQQMQKDEDNSFLRDLVTGCAERGHHGQIDELPANPLETNLVMTLTFIESNVLPKDFSSHLRRAAFPNEAAASSIVESPLDATNITLVEFLEGMTRLFGRSGSGTRTSLELIFSCCYTLGNSTPPNEYANAQELTRLGYQLGLSSFFLSQHIKDSTETAEDEIAGLFELPPPSSKLSGKGDPSLLSLAQSICDAERNGMRSAGIPPSSNPSDDSDNVSATTFFAWAEAVAPLLSATLPTLMHQLMFPLKKFSPSRQPFLFPDIRGQTSFFFDDPFSPRLFSFACMSLSLGGAWYRLYTTEADGLSFNRLQLALLGYGGPTLMIVEAVGGGLFGAYTSTAWKESKDFYGNFDCFLFQMEPSAKVFRPRGIERNFMYCNSAARSKGYDQLAHGIGFGGSNTQPRLYISESLDDCFAGISDTTFEPGALLPHKENGSSRKYFEIESLEVWGCGGDAAVADGLEKRVAARAVIDANIRKAKKVDKAAFLDDLNSGLIEAKAFKHRGEIRGREGCDMDREDK